MLIDIDQRLIVDVPITLTGDAVLVRQEGAVVQQQMMTLTVESPAGNIPQVFEELLTYRRCLLKIRYEFLTLRWVVVLCHRFKKILLSQLGNAVEPQSLLKMLKEQKQRKWQKAKRSARYRLEALMMPAMTLAKIVARRLCRYFVAPPNGQGHSSRLPGRGSWKPGR